MDLVRVGDITDSQAIQLAQDVLFNNSNKLYNLNLTLQIPHHIDYAKAAQASGEQKSSNTILRDFEAEQRNVKYVYVAWIDYMGTMRTHVYTIKEFRRRCLNSKGPMLDISRGNTGTLQNDFITSAVNTTGVIYVGPDLSSLRPCHRWDTLNSDRSGTQCESAIVMSGWVDSEYARLPSCPRGRFISLVDQMKKEFEIVFLMGFEIEVTFLNRKGNDYEPITTNHAWSSLSLEQWSSLSILGAITDGLLDMGIEVTHFHAEAGQGQFEIVLPPSSPARAIDTLYQTRKAIMQIAHIRGVHATFHASPFSTVGSGAHVHISLSPTTHEMAFFAGVLDHLPSICAFTLPEAESYLRVVDDHWAGGRFVAWGTQNRETPLRRIEDGHWEVKCVDGFGNMYFGMAALLAAGYMGIKDGKEMKMKECLSNPGRLTDDERRELGIVQEIPANIEKAAEALDEDQELKSVLGNQLVDDYVVMKRTEQKMLGDMPEDERYRWLVERY